MQYQEEMDLYEKLTDKDPVDEIERQDQEDYRRYVHERRRRLQRRRRREKERQNRIRRIRLITGCIAAALILITVFMRVAAGNPVRDSLTLQVGSPMPEARAFLRSEKSKAEIYFLSDMTQVDMNVAGETEILLEVNGKQFESRLIVQNPDGTGAGNGTVVTDSSLQETPDSAVQETYDSTVQEAYDGTVQEAYDGAVQETDTDTAPNPERDTLQPAGAAGDKQYD